jgi:4-hydroxysphinganine ceramide fatty acyl 2-hydroxylase
MTKENGIQFQDEQAVMDYYQKDPEHN